MRRTHIFWDYEFTDGGSSPKRTGYGLSWGADMSQKMQDYYEQWPQSRRHAMKLLFAYNPRRFRP